MTLMFESPRSAPRIPGIGPNLASVSSSSRRRRRTRRRRKQKSRRKGMIRRSE